MTILFADGVSDRLQLQGKYDVFDFINIVAWSTSRHADSPAVAVMRATSTGNTHRLGKYVGGREEIAAGVAFYIHNNSANQRGSLLQIRDTTGALMCRVEWDSSSNGRIRLFDGANNLLDQHGQKGGAANNQFIQISVRILLDTVDPAQSHWEWYEGDNYLGQGTANLGSELIGEVGISAQATSTSSRDMRFEDFWITDGQLLYDARITTLRPNALGPSSDWERSDPLADYNYEMVNDVTPNFSTYVSSANNDELDLYSFEDLTVDEYREVVVGLQLTAVASKTDAEERSIRLAARPDTTTHLGDPIEVSSQAAHYQLWEGNPETSAPWELADVNASYFGFQSVNPVI